MDGQLEKSGEQPQPETFGTWRLILDVAHGIAITLGMALLWSLESVRDVVFRLLDKMNVKSRPRRASAFPPGRPRKRTTVDAHR